MVEISKEMLKVSVVYRNLKIANSWLEPYLTGANELICLLVWTSPGVIYILYPIEYTYDLGLFYGVLFLVTSP